MESFDWKAKIKANWENRSCERENERTKEAQRSELSAFPMSGLELEGDLITEQDILKLGIV